jgi:diguanylate cyclase (GGDEF)-like protein
VARQVSETIRDSVESHREQAEQLRDQPTGLPNRQHLERFIGAELGQTGGLPCSILLLSIRQVVGNKGSGRAQTTYLAPRIATGILSGLRGADLLFRYDVDRFVALLTQTDAATADAVSRRVAGELGKLRLDDDESAGGTFKIGRATAPNDGNSLATLVVAAENRLLPPPPSTRQSIH